MVPVLVAVSVDARRCLGGPDLGLALDAAGTWQGIDHGRSDPVPGGRAGRGLGRYALRAPVMLVRDPARRRRPVTERVPFARLAAGGGARSAPARPSPTSTTT